MISFFDAEKLGGLLKDFHRISRIGVTALDGNLAVLASWPGEVAPYCAVIRAAPGGMEACAACDRRACAEAAARRDTWVYRCHAGLTEAVTPLYAGDVPAGYLQFRCAFTYPSHEAGWAEIQRLCAALPVDVDRLREAVFTAAPIDEDALRAAGRVLHAAVSGLMLERLAKLKEDLPAVRLDAFLNAHYTEKLNAAAIARCLGIGKTQLYALSRQLYGCGTAERVRALRIERAKALLRDEPGLPLAEIASACGYADYNYFIAVFTREVGQSPGAWRGAGRGGRRRGK